MYAEYEYNDDLNNRKNSFSNNNINNSLVDKNESRTIDSVRKSLPEINNKNNKNLQDEDKTYYVNDDNKQKLNDNFGNERNFDNNLNDLRLLYYYIGKFAIIYIFRIFFNSLMFIFFILIKN